MSGNLRYKTYNDESFDYCEISLKIDGVRAHLVDGKVVSRAGNPLYNVPPLYSVCEVFLGSWEETVSAVRTHADKPIDKEFLYCLDPIDSRLLVHRGPADSLFIKQLMIVATMQGYEGLVIKSDNLLYKVKNKETHDVPVVGVIPGKGKHLGKMGALVTPMGNVGTGFSDEQRTKDYMGLTIEVEVMGLTPGGKFRHPRFLRIREDK